MISAFDYIQNKQKCEICGCTSFFSTSNYFTGIALKLVCKECDAEYIRCEKSYHFYLKEKENT